MTEHTEDIFHDALELEGAARQAFLEERCRDRPELRRKVEALLSAYEGSSELSLAPATFDDELPERIGNYTISGELGRGSMGIVYQARDETLGRELALKILPANLGAIASWTSRFEREARILASLNHPNIATIYSLEQADGLRFLTMELVEGPTLAQRLAEAKSDGSTLTLADSLGIAREIAIALEAAHDQDVVHRDLKPMNIKLTPAGTVKLLDFGIAKSLADLGIEDAHSDSPEPRAVGSSLLAGTPGYMSPEQRRGEAVDQSADVFAFGRILLECLSGRAPDPEDDGESTPSRGSTGDAASTATVAPPRGAPRNAPNDAMVASPNGASGDAATIAALPAQVSTSLRQLLESCTQPQAHLRASSMGDVRQAIETELQALGAGAAEQSAPSSPRVGRPITWISFFGIIVLIAAWMLVRDSRTVGDSTSWTPPQPTQLTFTGVASRPELSPQGDRIAFTNGRFPTRNEIVVMDLDGSRSRVVFETASIPTLRWAPDGRHLLIAGHAGTETPRRTFVVSVDGEPGAVTSFERTGPLSWSPDGLRFASLEAHGPRNVIRIDDIEGPGSRSLSLPAPRQISQLDWSPNGKWLAVIGGPVSARSLWIVPLDGTRPVEIASRAELGNVRWTGDGTGLYFVEHEDLWKIEIDPDDGTSRSEARLLVRDLAPEVGIAGDRVAFARGPSQSNLRLLDLAEEIPKDRALTTGTSSHGVARFSPDGRDLAFTRKIPSRKSELLVQPVIGGRPRSFARATGFEQPAWSPDGRRIAIVAQDEGIRRLLQVDLSTGRIDTLDAARPGGMLAWAPGDHLLFQTPGAENYIALDPEDQTSRVLFPDSGRRYLWQLEVAPDGRSAAVLETESEGMTGPRVILVDLETRSTRTLYEGLATPCGWSGDGRWAYLVTRMFVRKPDPESPGAGDESEGRIGVIRIDTESGEEQPVATLSRRGGMWSAVDISPDERWIVYDADELISDVWMIEGFDPE